MNRNKSKKYSIILILAVGLTICNSSNTFAQDYLTGEDITLISAASVGIQLIGQSAKNSAHENKSLIHGPILFDEALQKLLGGDCRAGKTNFLDNTVGSAATPVVFGLVLFAADSKWPETADKGKFVAQDVFLYTSGLVATKGITSLTKGLVSRQRPLPCLEPDIADLRTNFDINYDHNSFFSGHASSSFFAATFLNKRLRSIMRREMTSNNYHGWAWAPPTILYGWASFVGWSRMQAYKHFFTDIVAGALAGYLMGELFYSFNNYDESLLPSQSASGTKQIFSITLKF